MMGKELFGRKEIVRLSVAGRSEGFLCRYRVLRMVDTETQ